MHELSIVMSILDIVEGQVRSHHAQKVESIELEIGQLAGIEWEAMDFAWDAAVRNTVLENSSREIRKVEGRARCLECGEVFPCPTLFTPCTVCGSVFSDLLQGKELRIRSLVLI
jgi:hydrogenase nickel incorporation protein HypA/HybF